MSVLVTQDDLAGLEDLSAWYHTVARVASGVVTGGASELAWNKKARKALAKGVKAVAKGAAKVAAQVACPIADRFKDPKVAAASASTGYGVAANVAAGAVRSICPRQKTEVVTLGPPWWHSPVKLGLLAAGAGVVLGALFARR